MKKEMIYNDLVKILIGEKSMTSQLEKELNLLAKIISDENIDTFPYIDDITLCFFKYRYGVKVNLPYTKEEIESKIYMQNNYARINSLYRALSNLNYFLVFINDQKYRGLSEMEIIEHVRKEETIKSKLYMSFFKICEYTYYEYVPELKMAIKYIVESLCDTNKEKIIYFSSRQVRIFRELLGINKEKRAKSMDEIAQELNLKSSIVKDEIMHKTIKKNIRNICKFISDKNLKDDMYKEALDDLIENLQLDNRYMKALKNYGIITIQDLMELIPSQIEKINGLGIGGYKQLKEALETIELMHEKRTKNI